MRLPPVAAPVAGPDWTVVVEQPLSEAYGPIYAALWRTATLLAVSTIFAGVACLCTGAPDDRTDKAA